MTLLAYFFMLIIPNFGQNTSGVQNQSDIDRLNKYVLTQYCKATHKAASSVSATIVNTYLVDYPENAKLTKEHFESGEFLKHIIPIFLNGRSKGILCSETIVLENGQEVIGYFSEGKLRITTDSQLKSLAILATENHIVSMYQIVKDMGYTFRIGVDEEEKIFVIEEYTDAKNNKFCVGIWPIEDFPNEDWPRVFPWAYSRVGVDIFNTSMYQSRFPSNRSE